MMKSWWQQLQLREKRLVIIMGVLLSIFFFYQLIWQPLNENIVHNQKKLIRQQALLSWVNKNTLRYKNNANSNSVKNNGSISSIVNRTAKQHQITVSRMQPQGDDLHLWIEEIAFNTLLQWLEQLSNEEKLMVRGIDLSHGNQTGTVLVRRLHLGKN